MGLSQGISLTDITLGGADRLAVGSDAAEVELGILALKDLVMVGHGFYPL